MRTAEKAPQPCPTCGGEFYATAWELNGQAKPRRFCSKECGYKSRVRMSTKTEAERFWAKVEKTDTCWLWTAPLYRGYGLFALTQIPGDPKRRVRPHRWSYEQAKGPVPPSLDLDHLCRVRHCVNPDHLEPVTRQVNVQRGTIGAVNRARGAMVTHCPKGHAYDDANTYIGKRGGRACRICRQAKVRAWKRAQTRQSSYGS